MAHASWPDAATQLREERRRYGTDHALVALELLSEWNLPGVIVDAVGDHHRPDLHHRDLSTTVVAAELLVCGDLAWSSRFEVLGITPERLPPLRAVVAEQVYELATLLAP